MLSQPDAFAVAAASVTDPAGDLPWVDFGSYPMGAFSFSAMSALVLIALTIGLVNVTAALGVGVVALQEERRHADHALVVAGMARGTLARTRGAEIALAVLPAPLVAAGLAIILAVAYEHYDNLALPYLFARFAPIAVLPIAIAAVLAVAAVLATPSTEAVTLRHE
ncbi:MAG: hypothetical protein LBC97_01205 [Bifidobacteriaceae bacterium]|nr:hypothetical protein [Bifidobacteriaceae bacterium]